MSVRRLLYYRALRAAWGGVPDQAPVALHGLQRNGTNLLAAALLRAGCQVQNLTCNDRANPRHKHFRWYAEKTDIPVFLRPEYGNSCTALSVLELNQIARYDPDTVHLVVIKDLVQSVTSMINWGLRVGWVATAEDAVAPLVLDYLAYSSFWSDLARQSPVRVKIVNFSDLVANPTETLLAAEIDSSSIPQTWRPGRVPVSPKKRNRPVSETYVAMAIRKLNT